MVTRMSFGVLPLPFPRYALAPLHFRQVSGYTRRDNISKFLVVEQNSSYLLSVSLYITIPISRSG